MNYRKFAKIYSYSRISRYLKAAKGNKKMAQEMYYANARIARSFIKKHYVVIRDFMTWINPNIMSELLNKSLDSVTNEIIATEVLLNQL